MNDLQEQLQKLLLTDVKYLITDISSCANVGFKCMIRLQCSTSDECDQWVTEFSRMSLCTWRVRNVSEWTSWPAVPQGLRVSAQCVQ